MTDQIALVVPAGLAEPTRRAVFQISGPVRLIDVAHREIGPRSGALDASPVVKTPLGPFTFWSDDLALTYDDLPHNDRVIALCRAFGYDVPDVRGTIVITGGVSTAQNCLGLNARLLAHLEDGFADVAQPDAAPAHRPAEVQVLTGQEALDYLARGGDQ